MFLRTLVLVACCILGGSIRAQSGASSFSDTIDKYFSMDPKMGMLFIMDQERMQSFYMKNTYVSLDIIYINNDLEIVSIQKNAVPLDETSLPSKGPASLVLEIKGGLSDELGLAKGYKVNWQRIQ